MLKLHKHFWNGICHAEVEYSKFEGYRHFVFASRQLWGSIRYCFSLSLSWCFGSFHNSCGFIWSTCYFLYHLESTITYSNLHCSNFQRLLMMRHPCFLEEQTLFQAIGVFWWFFHSLTKEKIYKLLHSF